MLRTIFECVKNRLLSGVTELTDVRVFNSQNDFSDEHLPFKSPAVFIDFGDIEYETTGYKRQLGTTEVIVKLFHEQLTMNHLDVFDLQSKIDKQLQNYGEWGGIMERQDRETDDNFDRLYVLDTTFITTFVVDLQDESGRVPIGDWTNHPLSGTTTGVTDWQFSVSGYSSSDTMFPINNEDELAFAFDIIAEGSSGVTTPSVIKNKTESFTADTFSDGCIYTVDSATGVTATINTRTLNIASDGCEFIQIDTGDITLVAGPGVNLIGLNIGSFSQGDGVGLRRLNDNSFGLIGEVYKTY